MPRYDYKCVKCGKVIEIKHGLKEYFDDLCTCGGKLNKMPSKNVGALFKGSGFYCTDFKRA